MRPGWARRAQDGRRPSTLSTLADSAASRSSGLKQPQYLAPHVRVCELPEGVVFMDLRSLTYFALDRQCTPVLRNSIRNWPAARTCADEQPTGTPEATEVLDTLTSKAFLSFAPPARPLSPISYLAENACFPNWNRRASCLTTLAMLSHISYAYVETRRILRNNQLTSLLYGSPLLPAGRTLRRSRSPDLVSLLSLFAKLRLWFYTARDHCLLDSLVLSSVLRRYDIEAQLHIGVALMPFAAHAWVQVGSCVLDNTLDTIRRYTPLLIV